MKCPACAMETPEEQGFCDFCKEPFRRKAPPSEPVKPEKVPVPPEVMAKLLAMKSPAGSADPAEPDLMAEFARLDAGDRIPEVSPAVRKLAWGFLAAVLLAAALGTAYLMTRPRRIPPPGAPVIGVDGRRIHPGLPVQPPAPPPF